MGLHHGDEKAEAPGGDDGKGGLEEFEHQEHGRAAWLGLCWRSGEHGRGEDEGGGGEHDGETNEHGFLPKDQPCIAPRSPGLCAAAHAGNHTRTGGRRAKAPAQQESESWPFCRFQ
jgi:hypothetical protein